MEDNKNQFDEMMKKIKGKCDEYTKYASNKINEVFSKDTVDGVTSQVDEMINKASSYVQEGVQNINVENGLLLALKSPGAIVNRETFLKKVLQDKVADEMIQVAIENNPSYAGVSKETIEKIAEDVVEYEASKVSLISASTSILPTSIVSATVDVGQYFIFLLRTMQKLAYLYGFKKLELEQEVLDEDTKNLLMVFMGVMFDVEGAKEGLRLIYKYEAKNVAKDLANKSMTKSTIYPIVKEIVQLVSVKMTQLIFADGFFSVVPIMGAVASGMIAYATFKPCASRLQKCLEEMD